MENSSVKLGEFLIFCIIQWTILVRYSKVKSGKCHKKRVIFRIRPFGQKDVTDYDKEK